MENSNTIDNEILWNILANPADAKYAFTLNVDSLVDEYPQSGLYRALLAGNGTEENVRHAAVYFNPANLYKLINTPDSLPVVKAAQIFRIETPLANMTKKHPQSKPAGKIYEELNIKPTPDPEYTPVEVDDDDAVNQDIDAAEGATEQYTPFEETKTEHVEPVAETEEAINTEEQYTGWPIREETPAYHEEPVAYTTPEPVYEQPAHTEQPVVEAAPEPAYEYQAETPVADVTPVQPAEAPELEYIPTAGQTEYFQHDIEDEIYDEIVSIEDINLEQLALYNANPEPIRIEPVDEEHFVFEPVMAYKGIVNDYEDVMHPHIPAIIIPANEIVLPGNQNVARYYDEKLPYTFMWWLDKTRKEHADAYAYQPYVANPNVATPGYNQPSMEPGTAEQTTRTNPLDELQKGYVANFVNANFLGDLERGAANADTHERKEDKIIKRFIEAEPQFKNPAEVKLDNENKAKRSSEDEEELITETLARIYTEQMLYAKAITTYKKLMLKFPEKSLYFAGQIEQLEKKPN